MDCNKSVELKPDYAKAYSRLGAALMSLHKYREAADNGYTHAIRLEPANLEYKTWYEKAKAEADAGKLFSWTHPDMRDGDFSKAFDEKCGSRGILHFSVSVGNPLQNNSSKRGNDVGRLKKDM